MSLPARFQRARHPLGAPRILPRRPAPRPRPARPAPQPTPQAILEAMRVGAEQAERLQRWLAQERRAARWRARQFAELRRGEVRRTTDTSGWPGGFFIRGGGVTYAATG